MAFRILIMFSKIFLGEGHVRSKPWLMVGAIQSLTFQGIGLHMRTLCAACSKEHTNGVSLLCGR